MGITQLIGNRAERKALSYLKRQGLKLLEKNYHCKHGEIDLIMNDSDSLVFVEVRYRKNRNFGGALESITANKQLKLRKSAEHYLISTKKTNLPCRFDILCIQAALSNPEIEWVRNAF